MWVNQGRRFGLNNGWGTTTLTRWFVTQNQVCTRLEEIRSNYLHDFHSEILQMSSNVGRGHSFLPKCWWSMSIPAICKPTPLEWTTRQGTGESNDKDIPGRQSVAAYRAAGQRCLQETGKRYSCVLEHTFITEKYHKKRQSPSKYLSFKSIIFQVTYWRQLTEHINISFYQNITQGDAWFYGTV